MSSEPNHRIAIIGGGLSGLATAAELHLADPNLSIRLFEAGDRLGGVIHTERADGFLVDTPGIRSFELWDVIPEEVAGFMPELRPYVSACRFADCTHTHEDFCAVKDAVADGWIDARRYDSYVKIHSGE